MQTRHSYARSVSRRRILSVAGVTLALVIAHALRHDRQSPLEAQGVLTRFADPRARSRWLSTANGDVPRRRQSGQQQRELLRRARRPQPQRRRQCRCRRSPSGVAFLPDGTKAYVANTVSGTVSRHQRRTSPTASIRQAAASTSRWAPSPTASPSRRTGRKLYVTNARSNDVSVIDTATDTVDQDDRERGLRAARARHHQRRRRGRQRRDASTSRSSCRCRFAGKLDGADDAKAGHVTVISHRDRHGRWPTSR